MDGYFPFEMNAINFDNKRRLGAYEAQYLSLFTRVDYLRVMCGQNHAQTFQYRVREEQGESDYFNTIPGSGVFDKSALFPGFPRSFR